VDSLLIDSEFRSLIPPLEASELALLEESILEEGVRDAIVTWNGYIVDGHNRYDIITRHGIKDYRVNDKTLTGKSRDEVCVWIIDNQFGRRNISNFTRVELAVKREGYIKQEKINSVGRPAKNIQNSGQLKETNKTEKELAKVAKVSHDTIWKGKQIIEKAPEELKEKLRRGEESINAAYKEIKSNERKGAREKELEKLKARAISPPSDNHVIFYQGDFREIEIQDNSVDHIVTDPPYKAEYLDLWSDLAIFAARVLKPGGLCITYSGTFHLPEIIRRLSEHLQYYWQFILLHRGIWQRINARHLTTGYKPVLVFAKPPIKASLQSTWDIIEGTGREKNLHQWAQAEAELEDILGRLTYEGDTILDPFAGSGTTAMACRKTNRFNISIEINEGDYQIALGRLNDG